MSFLTATNEDVANIQEGGAGNYILNTGLYDVEIVRASYRVSEKGFKSVDFTFSYNGNEKTIYQLGLFNKDGKENFMMPVFKQLMTICGITDLDSPVKQNVGVKTKDGIKQISLDCFKQFEGSRVKVAVVKEWSKYQGELREKLKVHKFYSKDGFTGKEIAAGVKEPKQMDKDMEYLKDRYTQGATEEEVKQYINNQSTAPASASNPEPVSDADNPFAD